MARARRSTSRSPVSCWVEYELPRHDVIPAVTGYRYVKSKDVIQPDPRKEPEINKLYEKLIARVALRTLAEAFDAAPSTLVAGIVFNGYVSAKDRATGKPVRPLLLSVHARARSSPRSSWTSPSWIPRRACAATSTP